MSDEGNEEGQTVHVYSIMSDSESNFVQLNYEGMDTEEAKIAEFETVNPVTKCVICFNPVKSVVVTEELNLLKQLVLTLKFPATLSEDLSPNISNFDFCETCCELLCNSSSVLEKIESLEKEVEVIRSQFKEWILSTYNQDKGEEELMSEDDAEVKRFNARNYLRKTFVQCWVACNVDLKVLPEKQVATKAQQPVLTRTRQKKLDYRRFASFGEESDHETGRVDSAYVPGMDVDRAASDTRSNKEIKAPPKRKRRGRKPKAKRLPATSAAAPATTTTRRVGRTSLRNSKFKCEQCKRAFPNLLQLNRHMLAVHKQALDETEESAHNCPYCGVNFESLVPESTPSTSTDNLEDQEIMVKVEEGIIDTSSSDLEQLKKTRLEHIEACRNSFLASQLDSGSRVYDDRGKLLNFTCAHCKKMFSRSDYLTPEETFVFRCEPSCCGRTFPFFSNLILHHESFCPEKPAPAEPQTRKRRPLPNCTYDDTNRIIAFECSKCSLKMNHSEFYNEETESFVFQCTSDGCGKVLDNFSNLYFHHSSHCSSRPTKKPKYMDMQKRIEYILATTYTSSVAYAAAGAGRRYDANGKVSSYHCPRCKVELRTEDFNVPGTKEYKFKCFIEGCGKTTTTLSNLIFHHETHCLPQKKRITIPNYSKTGRLDSFQCIICNHIILNEGKAQDSNEQVVYICPVPDCLQPNDTFSALRLHHEHHCAKTIYIPREAGGAGRRSKNKQPAAAASSSSGLEEELQAQSSAPDESDPGGAFKCEKCGKAYPQQSTLDSHLKKCPETEDTSKVSFLCLICKRQFETEQLLEIHSRLHELKNQLQESFLQNLLESSRKTLSPEGTLISYHCQHCDKTIDQANAIPGDSADQENQIFKCWHDCCESNFDTFDRMVTHHVSACPMRKVHICHVCDKSFETRSEVRTHMKTIHAVTSKEKGKAAKKKSPAVKKTVPNKKPFACRHCSKRFRGKNNCIRHMRLHLDNRPSKCKTCGGVFPSRTLLKEHEESHERQDVECVHCDRMFKSRFDLEVHIKRVHPDIVI